MKPDQSKPIRHQRKRVRGWRWPVGALYVGRPGRFGNPFRPTDYIQPGKPIGAQGALDAYRDWLHKNHPGEELTAFLEPLRGRDLVCWCRVGEPCHADILLELANKKESQQ